MSEQTAEPIPQTDPNQPLEVPRLPWSQLAQEFAETWGRADAGDPQPEHIEVLGINGSGKTLWTAKAVQERMLVRHTPCIFLQSKPADATIQRLGWPIISDGNVKEALQERWSIFWPYTNAMGSARKTYQADHFRNLLNTVWRPDSNCIIVYDDFGYIETLTTSDGEPLAPIVQMFLREGRSAGITNVLIKQRPQGSRREMHSETQWTIAFAPKDQDDRERFAQILGDRKQWMPILEGMDANKREFVIKHFRTGAALISWVDTPLRPIARPKRDAKSRT